MINSYIPKPLLDYDDELYNSTQPDCYGCSDIGMFNYAEYVSWLTHSIIEYCSCDVGKRLLENDPNREELNRINERYQKIDEKT